jgi:hypothetical protein
MTQRGISTLLDLHQEVIDQEDGYWTKGWHDIAHAPKNRSGFSGRKLPYDHRHRNVEDAGIRYEFTDAHQLLSNFFEDVDRALRKAKEK